MSAVTMPSSATGPAQAVAHRKRLAACAVEPRILFGALRLADHEHVGVGAGVGRRARGSPDAQLAQQLDADRPGQIARRESLFVSSSSHGIFAVCGSSSICISPLPAR